MNIEDAHKNKESPFYNKLNFAPSTGMENDLFAHRFYKVDLKGPDNETKINWVDCLYFIKMKCWFVVKDGKIE